MKVIKIILINDLGAQKENIALSVYFLRHSSISLRINNQHSREFLSKRNPFSHIHRKKMT